MGVVVANIVAILEKGSLQRLDQHFPPVSNEYYEPISVELMNTSGKKEILDIEKGTFTNAVESTASDNDSVKFALLKINFAFLMEPTTK